MTDPTARRALTELYADQGWPAQGDELLQRSLGPRAPDLLLEAPGWLGLAAGQLVLDAGCRDATHPIALARRYGCRVLGVDLVPAWLPKGMAEAASAGLGAQVALVQGDLEALPIADGTCDLVWCRDVLSCVGDAAKMLRECARVLRPGGGMVLYAVFTTDRLAPGDRSLLVEGLGNSPASMHQPTVEAAVAAAGFEIARARADRQRMVGVPARARSWLPDTGPAGDRPAHPQPRPGRGNPWPHLVRACPGVCLLEAADRPGPTHAGPLRPGQTRHRRPP
jgi:SAM-dependent methyltransferase